MQRKDFIWAVTHYYLYDDNFGQVIFIYKFTMPYGEAYQ
jgi:hypothetical protein